jgi:hypothetical protein
LLFTDSMDFSVPILCAQLWRYVLPEGAPI